VQIELEDGKHVAMIDVRGMSLEQRKEVLAWWFNDHLHCADGTGHSWKSHKWLPELHVWVWGPCEKCGINRLTQTTGKYFEWDSFRRSCVVLVVDDDFDLVLQKLQTASWEV
jgi:hypothetical protein